MGHLQKLPPAQPGSGAAGRCRVRASGWCVEWQSPPGPPAHAGVCGAAPPRPEVRQGDGTAGAQPGSTGARGKGRGCGPQGRRQVGAWLWGGVWVPAALAEGSMPGHLLQRNLVRWGRAAGAGLSRGPRGGRAVRSHRAGRSPRSPCPAVPAVGLAAGGRPGACGGSPANAPASRRRAWGDRRAVVGLALPDGPCQAAPGQAAPCQAAPLPGCPCQTAPARPPRQGPQLTSSQGPGRSSAR